MKRKNMQTEKVWRSSRFLLAELVVVFIGVYGAFWVDGYREEQEREERTQKIILALIADLNDAIEISGQFSNSIETGLQKWVDSRVRGETPPPYVFRVYGHVRPPQSTWDAVLQSQVSELLESNLLFELGFFYNEFSGIGDRLVRYVEFTDREVLPRLKQENTNFYDEDLELLPIYAVHMDQIREVGDLFRDTVTWSKCIVARLESVPQITERCPTKVGVTIL
jgi:hypothetical protein